MSSHEPVHVSRMEVMPTSGKGTLGTWWFHFQRGGRTQSRPKPTHELELGYEQTIRSRGVCAPALKPRGEWEGSRTKCQGFKPDLGNSAVRHYRGAFENVARVEMRTQLAIERAGLVTLHLQPARRSSIPTRTRAPGVSTDLVITSMAAGATAHRVAASTKQGISQQRSTRLSAIRKQVATGSPIGLGCYLCRGGQSMAFPNDDPTVQPGDRSIQLIDWLVGRLEECLGEVLPLQTDDLLKDYAKDARNSMASAIEQLSLARARKEQQLGGRTS